MNNRVKDALKLSALTLSILVAGCGGGGTEAGDTVAAAVTLEGVAAKGIIKKGVVEVYSLDAQGVKSTAPVVTGLTNDDGTYSVKIPKGVLYFVVEVSAGAGTTMADEATGVDIAMPASMKLRNVVTLAQASEGTFTGHVSPLTEMAVQTATKMGGLSSANVAQAKAGVAVALGFDPEKVKPINSNLAGAAIASADEKQQGLVLAAISKMAKDGALDCPVADLACVVTKVAGSATVNGDSLELTNVGTIRTAMEAVVADPVINTTGTTSVAGTASFTQSTVPASTGTASNLLAAKQLVASLRNTGNALHKADATGALDLRAATMKQDFENGVAPLDETLLNWMLLIPRGIDHLARFKSGETQNIHMTVYAGGSYEPIGGCSIYSNTGGTILATSVANAVSVACGTNHAQVPGSYVATATGHTYKYVNKVIVLNPDAVHSTRFTYLARTKLNTRTLSNGVYSTSATTVGEYGGEHNRATGTIWYTKSSIFVTDVAIAGMMPARADEFGIALTQHELWNANFVRTDEGSNLFKYAVSGDFTSVKAGVAAGKVAVESGSFARVQEDGNGSIANNGLKEFNLIISGESGGSKVTGSLNLSNAKTDKNGERYIPTKVAFTGKLAASSAEFFSGTLSYENVDYATYDTRLPQSSTNFSKQTASVVGKVTVPNRPDLSVSISATEGAFGKSAILGQINDGTVVVNVSQDSDNAVETLKISSADGASVTIASGQDSGNIVRDNVTLGTFNKRTGIINYVDGSFESLK